MNVKQGKYRLLETDGLLRLFEGSASDGTGAAVADLNTNATTDAALSSENKTYYSKYLIDMAEPELVHARFGQKRPIPPNNGKTVEFRKFDSLGKATTPITEGVTPDGQKMSVSAVTCDVKQYGGYVTLSDILTLTAIDNNILEATKMIASQAGRTLDTIVREVLVGGTNVQYAEGQVTARASLVGGAASGNMYLTVDCINRAVRYLKRVNAKKIDGYYIGIIHPDCEYDIMKDPNWKYPHQYQDTAHIYENEIGEIGGVRFVESSEAKIFKGAGASNRDVYATLIIADGAYGVTEIAGGGLEHIIKQLGSGGTADPLDQRATVGWKATLGAIRLVEQYMVRIETASTFNEGVDN